MSGRSAARAILCLGGLLGCTPESIVIAHGPDASADAAPFEAAAPEAAAPVVDAAVPDTGSGPSGTCASDDDCRPGYFCEKERCNDPAGVCSEQPTVCGGPADPVCGCDGVTYFNECVRQLHGESRASFSECRETAKRCSPFAGVVCPPYAHCAVLQREGGTCDPNTFPVPKCWALPLDCSTTATKRYQPCLPNGERACLTLCQAIERQEPYVPVARDCHDRPPGP